MGETLSAVSADRLSLLYRLSQTFNSSLNLDEVLNTVMDEIIAATHAERGFVILRQGDGNLSFPVARGLNHTVVDLPQWQVSHGLIDRVLSEGEPLLTGDAQDDLRFEGMQSVPFLGLTSVMCAPLIVKDIVQGAVYVENRVQEGVFTKEDLDLLSAIATTAAIAIENARLFDEAIERGRIERELEAARNVQKDFTPRFICQPLNWEISAYLAPAREVSGDFYDVISLDQDRLVGLVIGDVTDKGFGAALFMALFRSLIRAFAEQHVCADGRLATIDMEGRTNQHLLSGQRLDESAIDFSTLTNTIYLTNQYIINHHHALNMFTTLFFSVIDPFTGMMEYVNCGHEPPIVVNKQGVKMRLNPTGPVLGLLPEMKFEIGRVTLAPGDTLLAYTDGVIDALNPEGQPFSEERLLSLIQFADEPTEELIKKITEGLQAYSDDGEQYDDITLLAARWKESDSKIVNFPTA